MTLLDSGVPLSSTLPFASASDIAVGQEPPVPYDQDLHTGDYWPRTTEPAWSNSSRHLCASCARG